MASIRRNDIGLETLVIIFQVRGVVFTIEVITGRKDRMIIRVVQLICHQIGWLLRLDTQKR